MAFATSDPRMDLVAALDMASVQPWKAIDVRDECAAARAYLLECAAAFAVRPSEDRLRDLNNAWMRAKRAIDAPSTGGAG